MVVGEEYGDVSWVPIDFSSYFFLNSSIRWVGRDDAPIGFPFLLSSLHNFFLGCWVGWAGYGEEIDSY